jgi:hypothetical protein
MCDERTELENTEYLKKKSKVTRRKFNKMSAGAGLAMMLPPVANAQDVVSSNVEVTTPYGTADCFYVHPASGSHAAVLVWPDIFGLRPAFEQMGTRLAQSGYSVLVVNPFYRLSNAPISRQKSKSIMPSMAGVRWILQSTMKVRLKEPIVDCWHYLKRPWPDSLESALPI